MIGDGVIALVELDPATADSLARGEARAACVEDYPRAGSPGARLGRDPRSIDNWTPGFGVWLIRRESDGLVVGDVGVRSPPDERGVVEIAFGLAPSARGRGLASRAVRLLCAELESQSGVAVVLAETDVDNVASVRVLEACGFARVGRKGRRLRFRR